MFSDGDSILFEAIELLAGHIEDHGYMINVDHNRSFVGGILVLLVAERSCIDSFWHDITYT